MGTVSFLSETSYAERFRHLLILRGLGPGDDGKWPQTEIAIRTGVSANTFKRILSDQTKGEALGPENSLKMARALNCDLVWLLDGSGTPPVVDNEPDLASGAWAIPGISPEATDDHSKQSDVTTETVVFVPLIRPQLLIRGIVPFQADTEWYAFPRVLLAPLAENIETLRVLKHRDDCMYPILKRDDLILVDTGRKTIENGRIYLFVLWENIFVSALERSPKGDRIVVRPQNSEHSSFDVEQASARIVGKCVWFGRILS